MGLIPILPPTNDAVTPQELMLQLGRMPSPLNDANDFLSGQLQPLINQAFEDVQGYCRRALMLQTWQWRASRFPRRSEIYRHSPEELAVPLPPMVAVDFVQYLDYTGTWQTLPLYQPGSGPPASGVYAYQVVAGGNSDSIIAPALWAGGGWGYGNGWSNGAWPLTLGHADAVWIQFRAGYGGTITLTVGQDGVNTTGYAFTQAEVGNVLTFPAVGQTPAVVVNIQAVDANGNATLSAAVTAGAGLTPYYGRPLPAAILGAIKFLAQFYYEQDVVSPTDWPPFVLRRLNRFRNLVS